MNMRLDMKFVFVGIARFFIKVREGKSRVHIAFGHFCRHSIAFNLSQNQRCYLAKIILEKISHKGFIGQTATVRSPVIKRSSFIS